MLDILLITSRATYIPLVFISLYKLERPANCRLTILVDSTEAMQAVDDNLDILSNYKHITVHHSGNTSPETTQEGRRQRIASLHNYAKHKLPDDSKYVLLVEDDTTFMPDAYTKLFETMQNTNAQFVEGVQLGRHGTPYVGAWVKIHNERIDSVNKSLDDYTRITAGGFYFALVDAGLYKAHTFASYNTDNSNGLSCDYNFGDWLTGHGYSCYIDWRVNTVHHNELGALDPETTTARAIQFVKVNNKWEARKIYANK